MFFVEVGLGMVLTTKDGERFLIRRATLNDEEKLCRVCLLTGDGGKDATSQYKDKLLLGRRWVMPYVELEPRLALCVVSLDKDGEICGYALGCKDTLSFSKRLNEEYLPRMRKLYPLPAVDEAKDIASGYMRSSPTKDEEVIKDFHSFELPPEHVYLQYPSHMHIDLVPRVQGQNLGRYLLGSLLHTMRESGADMIHLEMWISNVRAGLFYRRCGFRRLQEVGTNVYLGLEAKEPCAVNADEISGWMGDGGDRIMSAACLFAVGCNLFDWHESHIRTGERYSAAVAMKIASIWSDKIDNGPAEDMSVYEEVRGRVNDISTAWGNLRPLCGSCCLLMEAVVKEHGRKCSNIPIMLSVLYIDLLQAQVYRKCDRAGSLASDHVRTARLARKMDVLVGWPRKDSTTGTEWWRDFDMWERVLGAASSCDADSAHDLHAYPGYLRFIFSPDEGAGSRKVAFDALFIILGDLLI